MSTDERMLALARNVRAGLQKAIDYDDEVATVYAALMVAKRETKAEQSALSSAQGEGWVACSERMPDQYEIVQFVTGPGKGASPWDRRVGDRTCGPHWIWRDYTALDRHNETDIFEDHQVAYWAPLLPSPPKPEGSK